MKRLNILFIAVGMIVITKSTFCQSTILGNNGTVNTPCSRKFSEAQLASINKQSL
jgi:hypothetical protein